MRPVFDLVVIGGGFYGLKVALYAREVIGLDRVAVVESEHELMSRASYANQARVHNGYHYPRSILTAYRSRVNLPQFAEEFQSAIVDDFQHYYAIARRLSKVSSRQFEIFCGRIGAPWHPADSSVNELFEPEMIEAVYAVTEPAFDSRVIRDLLQERIEAVGGIEVFLGVEALNVASGDDGLIVATSSGALSATRVVGTTYSRVNVVNASSGLPKVSLQHEIAEMALVTIPPRLNGLALTVVDGPFFSLMPFPAESRYTLSHVRYTPRYRWTDSPDSETRDPYLVLRSLEGVAGEQWTPMIADVTRYVPALKDVERTGSLLEVKTVLTKSDRDDGRPIFFSRDHGIAGYTCVMGGKLDNVYDALEELKSNYDPAV